MTKKYYLKLKQGSDTYISPWKISNVIDDLAGEYYKKYLLNIVVDRVPDLNGNEELIIFNGSFDMYNKYADIKKFSISKSDDVLDIYYLGNPISLKPNLRIMKMSIVFQIHRRLYTKLKSIGILMDRSKIFDYIKPNFNDNKQFDLSSLQKYLEEILLSDEKEHTKVKNECNEIIRKSEVKLSKFVNHTVEFDLINGCKDEEELKEYLDKSKKQSVYKTHYDRFGDTFIKLGRPIVGIIDIEKGTLEILAKDFIREDLQNENENKIEMVDLSKNSPTAMAYIVGAIVVPWLASLLVTNLETRKIKQAKEINESEVATNPELLKLDEVIREFKDLQEGIEDISDKVVNIADYKVKKTIDQINNKITNKTSETLRKNGFLNENIQLETIVSDEEDTNQEDNE